MTFYVKTGDAVFNSKLKQLFVSRGYTYSRTFPVDIVFLSGEGAYYRNKQDLNKSTYVNVIYPRPDITYKEKLYRMFSNEPFIPKTHKLKDLPEEFIKILKPTDGYGGQGITIVTNKQEIQSWIESHDASGWVIQDYITNPDLKDGKKFHLRIRVVVAFNKVFICKDIRYHLAKEKYTQSNWKNTNIHDTHYLENQKDYFFPSDLPDGWTSGSLTEIQQIVKKVFHGIKLKAAWNGVIPYYIFGLDVMFKNTKPYLIEVNDRVGLKANSLDMLIPGIIDILEGKESPHFL
jgi:hypothetical protein